MLEWDPRNDPQHLKTVSLQKALSLEDGKPPTLVNRLRPYLRLAVAIGVILTMVVTGFVLSTFVLAPCLCLLLVTAGFSAKTAAATASEAPSRQRLHRNARNHDAMSEPSSSALSWNATSMPLMVRHLYHSVCRSVAFVFYSFICLMQESIGWKIHIAGHVPPVTGERALFLSNHTSHIDWFPLLSLAVRLGQIGHLHIVLKQQLAKAPIFGWALQMFLSIFLKRSRDHDMGWMDNILVYLMRVRDKASFLLFPEGTDINAETLAKSHSYAGKLGYDVYDYVLHPRTAGMVHILKHCRQRLDAIYDVTLVLEPFTPGEACNEASFLFGRYPRRVFMELHRIPIEEVPEDDEGVEELCRQLFARKERLLRELRERPADSIFAHSRIVTSLEDSATLRFIGASVAMALALYWFIPLLFTFWGLLFAIAMNTVIIYYCYFAGGIERAIVHSYEPAMFP